MASSYEKKKKELSGKAKYHSTPGAAKGAIYSKDMRHSDPTAWAKHELRKERGSLTRHGHEVLARMK